MFQLLFKYPSTVFIKGRFVLLSTWPAWLLPVFIVAAAGGVAWLIRSRMRNAASNLRGWRAVVVWGMQSALIVLILFLLWQPAILISELNSQQNIIAVVVDDSRSMAIADSNGKSREAAALAALEGGLLAGLQQAFPDPHLSAGKPCRARKYSAGNRSGGTCDACQRRFRAVGNQHFRSSRGCNSSSQRRQRELRRNGRLGHQRRSSAGAG